ncbi:hypothetical protein [Streptomyces sp. NPDC015350]|uniref:hypothetical protein n=1 Tax=Streptomyces sp. NPDC015350 TaxID=3364955 RepID=UPI003701489D
MSSDRRGITLHYAITDRGDLVIDVHDSDPTFPNFEDAIGGQKGQGLWTARQLGAELFWAPTDHGGKVVRAMMKLAGPA